MKVNKVEEGEKGNVFLAMVGSQAFEIIMNMCEPVDPSEKSYKELMEIAVKYYHVARINMTERQEFRGRKQKSEETVADYIVALKKLARYCNYGDTLGENLRDTFVGGLLSANIRRKLLMVKDLTWEKAQEDALALEAATREANVPAVQPTQAGTATVNKVSAYKKTSNKKHQKKHDNSHNSEHKCGRCLGNHAESKCPHLKDRCYNCNRYGHIGRACRNKPPRTGGSKKYTPQAAKQQHELSAELTEEETTMFNLFAVNTNTASPYEETLEVNGQDIKFMVDTGAATTVIAENLYNTHFSNIKLKPCSYVLSGYSGNKVPVAGMISVDVKYENQNKTLPIVVVQGERKALLGRNWMEEIRLNWSKILRTVNVNNVNTKKTDVKSVMNKYSEVFEAKDTLNRIKNFTVDVKMEKNAQPIFHKARPVPYSLANKVQTELNRLEKQGVIKKVETSKWASPIVVAPKTDGSIRICGDYKATVNTCVETKVYPLPTAEDIFAKLAHGQYFSKIDLTSAYQQLELTEESKEKLTINTPHGLYQYERLAFGVSTAPNIFQCVMDQVLHGIDGVCCYLDDILISTDSYEKHVEVLEMVLQRLSKHNILAKKSKCEFAVPEVIYLGHRISGRGIQPTEEKIEAIGQSKTPGNVSELRTFLGMVTYYQKFIPNLSNTCAPLYELLNKKKVWYWSKDCEDAVKKLKGTLTSETVLVHYDPNKELMIATDASPVGVGCVMSHRMADGSERPIAYASRSLTSAEKNYPQIEREALGIVFGIRKFHKYLYGREFTLITDNKPLTTIFAENKEVPTLAALRLQRWALILMAYQYKIQYRSSQENSNADMLSRLTTDSKSTLATEMEVNHFTLIGDLPITADDIAEHTRKDRVLAKVHHFIMNGWPNQNEDEEMEPYFRRREELSAEQGCILWGIRVVVPPALQKHMLNELHHEHLGVVRMKGVARGYFWFPGVDEAIEKVAAECSACQSFRANPAPAPLKPWKFPAANWERVHIDFFSWNGNEFLILIDSYSKWIEVEIMRSTTSERTITALRKMFARFGIPKELVSDNGPQLTSEEFRNFLQRNGVKHTLVPAYHPASNGAAERSVQIVKSTLKKHLEAETIGLETKLSLAQRLDDFLLTYRVTPQSTTGRSPAELFLKRELRTRFSFLRPDLGTKVKEKQERQIKAHDPIKPRQVEFKVNETVSVRSYLGGPRKWDQGIIMERLGQYWYMVKIGQRYRKVHVEQLLKSQVVVDQGEETGARARPPQFEEAEMKMPETAPENQEEKKEEEPEPPEVPVSPSEPSGSTVVRRSSRIRRRPERLIETK